MLKVRTTFDNLRYLTIFVETKTETMITTQKGMDFDTPTDDASKEYKLCENIKLTTELDMLQRASTLNFDDLLESNLKSLINIRRSTAITILYSEDVSEEMKQDLRGLFYSQNNQINYLLGLLNPQP